MSDRAILMEAGLAAVTLSKPIWAFCAVRVSNSARVSKSASGVPKGTIPPIHEVLVTAVSLRLLSTKVSTMEPAAWKTSIQ
ncbi:hypothetical protein D3C86_1180280 [compost metagenome]